MVLKAFGGKEGEKRILSEGVKQLVLDADKGIFGDGKRCSKS